MEFFSTLGKVVNGSGLEATVYQGRICTSGGMKGAISDKRIAVIPTLSMNVLQKLLTDSCPEYILDIPDAMKDCVIRIIRIEM